MQLLLGSFSSVQVVGVLRIPCSRPHFEYRFISGTTPGKNSTVRCTFISLTSLLEKDANFAANLRTTIIGDNHFRIACVALWAWQICERQSSGTIISGCVALWVDRVKVSAESSRCVCPSEVVCRLSVHIPSLLVSRRLCENHVLWRDKMDPPFSPLMNSCVRTVLLVYKRLEKCSSIGPPRRVVFLVMPQSTYSIATLGTV